MAKSNSRLAPISRKDGKQIGIVRGSVAERYVLAGGVG